MRSDLSSEAGDAPAITRQLAFILGWVLGLISLALYLFRDNIFRNPFTIMASIVLVLASMTLGAGINTRQSGANRWIIIKHALFGLALGIASAMAIYGMLSLITNALR